MTSDDDDEAALLARFNALRAPVHVPKDTESNTNASRLPSAPSDSTDRRAREHEVEREELERIADGENISDQLGSEDPEVAAFLASLSAASAPGTTPLPTSTDPDLEHDAASALRDADKLLGAGKDHGDEPGEIDDGDEETEEEILERALAEATLERDIEGVDGPEHLDKATTPEPRTTGDDSDPFQFPSLPTHALPDDDPVDAETQSKMAALLGLKGPSQFPSAPTRDPQSASGAKGPGTGTGRQAGQGWSVPGYEDGRDDHLESWCCICNKDAELKCLGCEGDIYCLECWKEGHESGDERRHKVERFVWDRKKATGV